MEERPVERLKEVMRMAGSKWSWDRQWIGFRGIGKRSDWRRNVESSSGVDCDGKRDQEEG